MRPSGPRAFRPGQESTPELGGGRQEYAPKKALGDLPYRSMSWLEGRCLTRALRAPNVGQDTALSPGGSSNGGEEGFYCPCIIIRREKDSTLLLRFRIGQVPAQPLLSGRGLLAYLVILCLTITLANRTVHVTSFDKVTAKSASTSAKIQHRDKDGSEWVAPPEHFAIRWISEQGFAPRPSGRELLDLHCESLNNRPPPIS